MVKILQGIKAISGVIGFYSLKKEQRQVTFYSEGKNYWPHLQGLLKATLKKTGFSVCYISSSLEYPGLFMKHPKLNTFFIGMASVRDYFFKNVGTDVMVMTMPDLHKYQIKRSKHNVHYIYVQHSLVSLHHIYRHGAFDHYDTICAAGPHHVEEIRAIEAKYDLPQKKVSKIGYSRLDYLIKNLNTKQSLVNLKEKTNKIILIAPSWGSRGIIESGLGKNLTDQLLNLGHQVILRPHPQTIKFSKEKIEEIKNKHKNNLSFNYEGSVSGQESLFQSDIMISDWSGVALEYAFAFNKPIIFCDLPKKINNPNHHDIKIEPIEISIREKIGVVWDGISPLHKMIELCSQKKNNIETIRSKYCYNVGKSDDEFVKILSETISINKL